MNELSIGALTFEANIDPERECALEDRLRAFYRAHAASWDENHDDRLTPSPLHIFVLDEHKKGRWRKYRPNARNSELA